MKLTFRKRIFLVVLACSIALAYRWISFHIWFPHNDLKILVNGSFNPMLSDHLPGKSLNGDIFLRNQDHGPQYLISVKKKEVSIICEDEGYIDLGLLTYTHDALTNLDNPKIRTKLSDPGLVIGDRSVEFVPAEGERWHISY
jgi:hypothetical protein